MTPDTVERRDFVDAAAGGSEHQETESRQTDEGRKMPRRH
jgi:hypothetical protein